VLVTGLRAFLELLAIETSPTRCPDCRSPGHPTAPAAGSMPSTEPPPTPNSTSAAATTTSASRSSARGHAVARTPARAQPARRSAPVNSAVRSDHNGRDRTPGQGGAGGIRTQGHRRPFAVTLARPWHSCPEVVVSTAVSSRRERTGHQAPPRRSPLP
jgi:hypothetical protein